MSSGYVKSVPIVLNNREDKNMFSVIHLLNILKVESLRFVTF